VVLAVLVRSIAPAPPVGSAVPASGSFVQASPTAADASPSTAPVASLPPSQPAPVVATIPLDGTSIAIAVEGDRVWVLLARGLAAIDGTDVSSVTPLELEEPRELAVSGGSVWATGGGASLMRFDPTSGDVERYGIGIDGDLVAASGDYVWVAGLSSTRRLTVTTGEVSTPSLAGSVLGLVVDGDRLWATHQSGIVTATDIASGEEVVRIGPGQRGPSSGGAIAAGEGSIWVIDPADRGRILRIEAASGTTTGTVRLGPLRPSSIAAGADRVWVLAGPDQLLLGLDPQTLEVAELFEVPGGTSSVVVASGEPVLLAPTEVVRLEVPR
jgi:streptogramin lyase